MNERDEHIGLGPTIIGNVIEKIFNWYLKKVVMHYANENIKKCKIYFIFYPKIYKNILFNNFNYWFT